MAPHFALLDELENLTTRMLKAARLEDLAAITPLELAFRRLLPELPKDAISAEFSTQLHKIIAELREISACLSERRDEISTLISALGASPSIADQG